MTHASPVPWMDDSLLDALPVAACICEAPSGRIIGCNPKAIALWGHRPAAEARIHEVLRFVRPDGSPLAEDETPFADVDAATGHPALIDPPGGGTVRVSISVVPVRRTDGSLDTRLMVFDSATDRRGREALIAGQSRILEMIAQGTPLAAIVDTITGVIEAQTDGTAVATIMLLSADGRHLRHAGAPSLPDHFKKTIDALEIGALAGTCGLAAWRRRAAQTETIEEAPEWAAIADAPRAIGLRAAWAMPIVSSTKRILGTIGLYFRQSRGPSADEREGVELLLQTAAIAIERHQAADAAAEGDRRRDEFLAMIAHELRNPLAPIRTAAQLLGMAEGAGPVTAKVQEVIERQVQNLTRIIDDLLDVSRITRGVITLQTSTIEIATITARAVETASPHLQKRDHALTVSTAPGPLFVCADPARLEQVIVNLLTNAAKFTARGGAIAMRVVAASDDTVAITVTDNGRGIPPSLIPHVFDLFVQGSRALDRTDGGLGIGLTVARRLVEMHGGSIDVRSDGPGFGSQFTVTLPRAAAPTQGDTPRAVGRAATPRRILVVEDRLDTAEMLALLLRSQAHDVRVANDGHAALLTASEFHPDVMLIDIGLPGMSGYDLAERIRRDRTLAHVWLVAVTGYSGVKDRSHALECGFDEHMAKPVDERVLADLLQEASPRRPQRPATDGPRSSWVIEPDFVE